MNGATKARVLLVEDIPDMLNMVGGWLEDEGYEVDTAFNKEEALEKLAGEKYHIAILDVNLDQVNLDNRDGLIIARDIRERFPNTWIVLLTGHGDLKMVVEALSEQRYADRFVLKDEMSAKLMPTVKELQSPDIYPGKGSGYAVIAGVNEYDDDDNYQMLHVCINDANALRSCLVANGYQAAAVSVLTNPTSNQLINAVFETAICTKEDDRLFVFFSGHGDVVKNNSYVIGRDSYRGSLEHTGVAIKKLTKIIADSPARAKVLVVDSCHSGLNIEDFSVKAKRSDFMKRVFEDAEGIAILSSCQKGELSYEWNSKGQSVFTYYLLEALGGNADFTRKGFVTINDTNLYVLDRVSQWAKDAQRKQTPKLLLDITGDIILTTQ